MGRHYDALVYAVENMIMDMEKMKDGRPAREYLSSIIENAKVIEFPLCSEEIKDALGMKQSEYNNHLNKFLEKSKAEDTAIFTPYDLSAIEDPKSIVIADNIDSERYILTCCESAFAEFLGMDEKHIGVLCGYVKMRGPFFDKYHPMAVINIFDMYSIGSKRVFSTQKDDDFEKRSATNIANSAIAYIEQAAYIMNSNNTKKKLN